MRKPPAGLRSLRGLSLVRERFEGDPRPISQGQPSHNLAKLFAREHLYGRSGFALVRCCQAVAFDGHGPTPLILIPRLNHRIAPNPPASRTDPNLTPRPHINVDPAGVTGQSSRPMFHTLEMAPRPRIGKTAYL